MRIGLVCPYAWDSPGGVRSHVNDLALSLMERGHEVSVLAPVDASEDLPEWVVDGGRPVAVPYNGSVARLNFGVQAARRVRRWIRGGRFDILHVHEPVAPGLSLLACWAARGPMVGTWHSSNERSRVLAAGYYIAQTAMEKLSARIAVSEDARRTLVGHVGGDAVLIPNGVRVSAFESPPLWPDARSPSILFLGRMDEPRKGLDVLCEALPRIVEACPEVQVLIAGPGDVKAQRERLPASVRDHVAFLGRVSDQEKASLLHSVDLYVAPHTGGESFGIVLAEAMAARTAVLCSNLPAFRAVLGDGGVLFANGDASALAEAAIGLLSDATRREEIVERGWARVQRFDWNRVVNDVIEVYESVSVAGVAVTEDLRGQIVGRLVGRGDAGL